MKISSLVWLFTVVSPQIVCSETEEERIAARLNRGYTWPPSDAEYKPNSPGWKKLFEHRLRQVEEIEDTSSRFEAYVQTLSASIVQPNFTEYGFGLARAPDDLMEALRQGIYDGLEAGPREEAHYPAIAGQRPWFIDRPDLMTRVLKELQHYPEAWSGLELKDEIAYGQVPMRFRLYRNQSNLYMHVDKPETHVISFILHIDSSEDAEPWPILIEDYEGTTHEVVLTSGDMLFYESSKCFHGRPHKFNGSWYSSVFVHYYPRSDYKENFNEREKVWAIPNHWQDAPKTHHETPIVMHGTTFEEPSCPNGWCQTKWTKKWSGPGKDGYWIAPTGEAFPFQPKEPACEDYSAKCREWVTWDTDECNRNPNFMRIHCKQSCNVCSDNVEAEL